MAAQQLIVFCYLPGAVEAIPAGRFEHDAEASVGSFQYGLRYVERADAAAVDCVSLPLGVATAPVTTNGGLYGAFRDACPDYWGRLVIARGMQCPIEAVSELDYLIHANATRVGNLDFRASLEAPEPILTPPRFSDLGALLDAANELESGSTVDPSLQLLLEQGSSLGGARPKCTIEADGVLWLAKFPSRDDSLSIPRVEYATMTLARSCGLRVPELRLERVGERDVLLVRRFDRNSVAGGWSRRGYLSALSLAQWDERDRDRWSYRSVADLIRRHSVSARQDLHELFLRIGFNILVRNTDDHPRNHGFLLEGGGVSLSPLFDVLPTFARRGVGTDFFLAMGLGAQGRLASIENLASIAPVFDLKQNTAMSLLNGLREQVSDRWQETFAAAGLSDGGLELLAPSFGL
jgi:serine/threonine-protein kinase HipA